MSCKKDNKGNENIPSKCHTCPPSDSAATFSSPSQQNKHSQACFCCCRLRLNTDSCRVRQIWNLGLKPGDWNVSVARLTSGQMWLHQK